MKSVSIAQWLSEHRKARVDSATGKRMTQVKICKDVGISRTYYMLVENGQQRPSYIGFEAHRAATGTRGGAARQCAP